MQTTVTMQQPTPAATMLTTLPLPASRQAAANGKLQLHRGQPIFDGQQWYDHTYLVTSGEVLIVRNGSPIDLVEAGELLEATLWPDAIAIALTACTLELMEIPIPRVQPC